ncbi:glycosyltransferase [Brachyspira sp. SAP_772]|uniref:glycosyltransferase family 8 protein n=1 Tax=Brachyspira sp. SAP_772 TaxID=2608385 RepID=UPI0012F4C229|nr:glycosyltransferase [Brachyspira sp. SAP_772]
MQEKFDICFLCNGHNYAINLGITIVSLLVNSDEYDNFYFHVLTSDMTEEDRKKLILLKEIKDFDIKFYDIDDKIIDKYKKLEKGKNPAWWGYHVLLKLEVPNILKDLDKVLFLDIDLIILKSLKEIFNENIDDYCLLTCYLEDSIYFMNNDNYEVYSKIYSDSVARRLKVGKKLLDWIPGGFMYLNLKKLREMYDEEKIINYISYLIDNGTAPLEERIINHFLNKDRYIKRFGPCYHRNDGIWLDDKYIEDMYIAHCTCGKIFSTESHWIPKYKNKVLHLGWKYLTMTQWFKEDPIYFLENYSKYNTHFISNELADIKNKTSEEKLKKLNEINKANEEKLIKVINKIVWFIPIRNIRNNVRNKMKAYFNI